MVEAALVIPLFITMMLFSLFFTELVRGKLKLQEAARYAAWEMTSYVLSDYGQGDNDGAFTIAQKKVVDEASFRFQDLDSIEDNQPFTPFADFDKPVFTIEDETINFLDTPVNQGGPLGGMVSGLSNGINWALGQWKFDTKGKVKVTVTSAIHSKLLGQHFLDTGSHKLFNVDQWGGHSLNNLPLRNTFSLVATGWDLPDGGNANSTQGRAGRHGGTNGQGDNSGLYTEVSRIVFLGLKSKFTQIPGLQQFEAFLGFFLPDPTGTFVVSHNYFPNGDPNATTTDCGNTLHPALSGVNNLNDYPGLDYVRPRCFDTAPFHDTAAYSDSLYIQMFKGRGNNFMGCKFPQADDPTFKTDSNGTDNSTGKTNCE